MRTPTLSKSKYIKGVQCPKALWFACHRRDLRAQPDASMLARFETGNAVGQLAMHYFEGSKAEVKHIHIDKALQDTQKFLEEQYALIFEAAAMHPHSGCHARIDILHRVGTSDVFDLIEVKSSARVKQYHIRDLSFQYHVFRGAGYNIRRCCMLVVNRNYTRKGDINPKKLLRLEDITEQVLTNQTLVKQQIRKIVTVPQHEHEPNQPIGKHCFEPFQCDFYAHCWDSIPNYSVYDIFRKEKADTVAELYGTDIESLPALDELPDECQLSSTRAIDVQSYLDQTTHVVQDEILSFLRQLRYPLYFLDYETLISTLPLFDGTRPFQKIPFQFSLHIQDKKNAACTHHGYLHKERTDPRPALIEQLLDLCGQQGSVVVYNQAFESTVNTELGQYAPRYKNELEVINARMIDLYLPFRKRWLYHPDQHSSASIKSVLPAFTDLTYKSLSIGDGGLAMLKYEAFMRSRDQREDFTQLWQDLNEYCKLDTLSMVKLLQALHHHAEGPVLD